MKAAVRERRHGTVIVVVVLVAVCAFWAIVILRSEWYKAYRRETELKETLQAIKPPDGARSGAIRASKNRGPVYATGFYSSDLDFDQVKSHYLEEFPRHGFVYKGDSMHESTPNVSFCAPHYQAVLSPYKIEPSRKGYVIFLVWKDDTPC